MAEEELKDDDVLEGQDKQEQDDSDGQKVEVKVVKETKEEGKVFTQAQLNKMMTKEKNQGRNSAYNELGIDPKDTKMVAMFKSFIESQKTDDQKNAEQQQQEQLKVQEAINRAAVAEAKVEALSLGVQPNFVEDVITLALSKLGEDGDLKTIIGEFKTKYPVWFEKVADESDSKKTGQRGTGSSVKVSKEDSKDGKQQSLGQRLAAQRKSKAGSTSYWGKN